MTPPRVRPGLWSRGLYALLAVALVSLAATGYHAALLTDSRLTGSSLLIHCAAGGLFAVALALAALTWAAASRMNGVERALFWLFCGCGLISVLSAQLGMLPWCDEMVVHTLQDMHRYGALGLVCVVLAHIYYTILGKPVRK